MLSFVVQNFFKNYPINEKTPKSIYYVTLKFNKSFILSVINMYSLSTFFRNNYFSVYRLHSTLVNLSYKLQPNNLLLSLKFLSLNYLLDFFKNKNKKKSNQFPQLLSIKNYLIPLKSTSVPFFKNKLNNLFYLNIILTLYKYVSVVNFFNVTKLLLVKNPNLRLVTFLNLFYFKIKNY